MKTKAKKPISRKELDAIAVINRIARELDPKSVTPEDQQVLPRYRCESCSHEFSDKSAKKGYLGCPNCKRSGNRLRVIWLNLPEVLKSKYGIVRQ
jgi:protein-arginine kinase activator protein McsA